MSAPDFTTDLNRRLGRRARELRLAAGLTLKAAQGRAEALGTTLHFTTLAELERGEMDWTARYLVRVARVLDIDVEELISPELGELRSRVERAREVLATGEPRGSSRPPEPPARAPPRRAVA